MTNSEFRSNLIWRDIAEGKLMLQDTYLVFGLVRFLEAGRSMYETIAEFELAHKDEGELLSTLDRASSWIRANQDELKLSL